MLYALSSPGLQVHMCRVQASSIWHPAAWQRNMTRKGTKQNALHPGKGNGHRLCQAELVLTWPGRRPAWSLLETAAAACTLHAKECAATQGQGCHGLAEGHRRAAHVPIQVAPEHGARAQQVEQGQRRLDAGMAGCQVHVAEAANGRQHHVDCSGCPVPKFLPAKETRFAMTGSCRN